MSEPDMSLRGLLDIYKCSVCLHTNDEAVSLNPCGHEIHEECAIGVMQLSRSKCPVCRADVEGFRPAFVTRDAVEFLLKRPAVEVETSRQIEVRVEYLSGRQVYFQVSTNDKVARIFRFIKQERNFPEDRIILLSSGQKLEPWKMINDYIGEGQNDWSLHCVLRFGGGSDYLPGSS